MSLDTVAEDIRDEARADAEEIREAGANEAEEIVEAAEAEAEEILAAAERDVESQIAQEREQRRSSAKLQAKQLRLEARRDVLEEVHERVRERLAELGEDRREPLTRALLEEAATEFDEGEAVDVYCRADDEDLLESILEDYDGFSVAGEYDCLGGVVVESEGSRVRVNNTFDSILEDVWEDNLKDVSAQLFDEQ